MADLNAGSILVELKAKADDFKRGMEQAKTAGTSFGQSFAKTAATVNAGGAAVAGAFDKMSAAQIRHEATTAKHIARLFALQNAFQTLGAGFGKTATSIQQGLSVFALAATAMPNQVGLVVGALGGLAVAMKGLLGPTEEETAALAAFKAEMASTEKALGELEKRGLTANLRAGLNSRFPLGTPSAEQATQNETLEERARLEEKYLGLKAREAQIQKEIRDQGERLVAAEDRAFDLTGLWQESAQSVREEMQQSRDALAGVEKAIGETLSSFEATTKEAKDFTATLEAAGKRDSLVKGITEGLINFQAQLDANKAAVRDGLVTPLDAAKTEADIFLSRARAILDFQAALGQLPADIRSKVQLTLPNASPQAAKSAADQASSQAAGQFAAGLSSAIGQGIQDGIIAGAPAMKILTDVGQNLFSNMLSKAVEGFQTSMVGAFRSIAGAGGEILGGALTVGLGIAGGILANRRSKSSESFSSVRSIVDSTQPVRGIVAGPASVAVAQVGEDIARANLPVVEGIKLLARIMNKVEQNTRGEGFAGSSGGPIVGLPTA